MGKYIHVFDDNIDFGAEYNGTGYTEPWVSYTKEGGISDIEVECTETGRHYGAKYGGMVGGVHKWEAYALQDGDPGGDYWTATRELTSGDPVYLSSSLTGYYAELVDILDYDGRVDYNKGDEPGPIVCDYFLMYDMEDYQTGVSNLQMFNPPTGASYNRGSKIWTPFDGDIDLQSLNPSDLPVNIAVTINNLGTHGNNVTRAWTFPAPQDWTTVTCGFPFTAEDFGEEPGDHEVWGVGYGSGPEILVGIIAASII